MNVNLGLSTVLRFIWNHPFNKGHRTLAISRFVKWQIHSRVFGWKIVYPLTSSTVMVMKRGMAGATGNIYCGLLEFEDMWFLLHALTPEDLFVDVGANVGVYSILSSGEIGARTISIEPVKRTFESLKTNVKLNDIESRVTLRNIGIGDKEGLLTFTSNEDAVNHVLSGDEDGKDGKLERVPVDTLDNVCAGETPFLLKIDVEGFETNVIKGASRILGNPGLKCIIIELNGDSKRYGFDESLIHETLLKLGFGCYSYEPYSRVLTPLDTYGSHNTIYIRDLKTVESRIEKARKIGIINKSI